METLRELSLFSGAGGGLLGTKLLGWRHCGYVEYNEYCQKVIAQRIKDGILDEAPIFGDIRAFLSEGYAESYQGLVDVVTAGFPCQPFSIAGKRAGENDERNMWWETHLAICRVRPRLCLLENTPGLLTSRYFGTIIKHLASAGYHARGTILGASDVGANHNRKRVWIVAWDSEIADPTSLQSDGGKINGCYSKSHKKQFRNNYSKGTWWGKQRVESRICGMDDGIPYRVDRLKSLGNGQVPAVVRAAWRILSDNF